MYGIGVIRRTEPVDARRLADGTVVVSLDAHHHRILQGSDAFERERLQLTIRHVLVSKRMVARPQPPPVPEELRSARERRTRLRRRGN